MYTVLIHKYSSTEFALFGRDSVHFSSDLSEAGCVWIRGMVNKFSNARPKKKGGWIFTEDQRQKIAQVLKENKVKIHFKL